MALSGDLIIVYGHVRQESDESDNLIFYAISLLTNTVEDRD